MDADLLTRLQQAAHTPTHDLDFHDVQRRANRLRRRRTTTAMVAAIGLVAIPVGIVAVHDGNDRPRVVSPPISQSAGPGAASADGMEPRTHAEGDQIVMPVTFPDGTHAELAYPNRLADDFGRFAVHPYGSGSLPGCCQRDFSITTGDRPAYARRGVPLKTFPGTEGRTVTYWRSNPGDNASAYLLFQFGRWYVSVWDGAGGDTMSDGRLATWAKNLHGEMTDDGFLILRGTSPLRLATGSDHGASLDFQVASRLMQLRPTRDCSVRQPKYASGEEGLTLQVCRSGILISAQMRREDKDFLTALANDLQVRNVKRSH